MVEIIVTAIIFVTAAVGILATTSTLRPQGRESVRRLEAAYLAKKIIEEQRSLVDAATWDSGALIPGTYTNTIDGYTVDWTITDVPVLNVRRLDMTVSW